MADTKGFEYWSKGEPYPGVGSSGSYGFEAWANGEPLPDTIQGLASVSQTAIVNLEAGSPTVSQTASITIEANTTITQTASITIEANTTITQTAIANLESAPPPITQTASINIEASLNLTQTASITIEAKASITQTAILSLESFLPLVETALLNIESTKTLLQQAQQFSTSIEARGFVAGTRSIEIEAKTSIDASAQIPWESPLLGSAAISVESKRVVSQTAEINFASELAAVQAGTVAIEWLRSLSVVVEVEQTAKLSYEYKAKNISSTSVLLIESSKATSDAIAIVPIEWRTDVGPPPPIEWNLAVLSANILLIESAGYAVVSTASLNIEAETRYLAPILIESKWVTSSISEIPLESRALQVSSTAEILTEAKGFPSGQTAIPAILRLESRGSVSNTVTVNVESLNPTATKSAEIPIEWEWNGRNVGSSASIGTEWYRVLEFPVITNVESFTTGSSQTAQVAVESTGFKTQSVELQYEAAGDPVKSRARILWEARGLRFNIEWRGSVASAVTIPVESNLASVQQGEINWSCDGLIIHQESVMPVESLYLVEASSASLSIEAVSPLAVTAALIVESLIAATSSSEILVESTIYSTQLAVIPVEARGSVSSSAEAKFESNLVGGPGSAEIPVESTGYSTQVAVIPVEARGSTSNSTVIPVEAIGYLAAPAILIVESLTAVTRSAETPIESIIYSAQAAVIPVEATQLLAITAEAKFESNLVGGPGLAEQPIESIHYNVISAEALIESKRQLFLGAETSIESLESHEDITTEIQLESSQAIDQEAEVPYESIMAVRDNYAEEPLEWVIPVSTSSVIRIESLLVAETGSAQSNIESNIAAVEQAVIPVEVSPGRLVVPAILGIESLQPVSSSVVIRWEISQSRSWSAQAKIESTGYRTQTGNTNNEARGFVASDSVIGLSIESLLPVDNTSVAYFESNLEVRQSSSAPIEAQHTVVQSVSIQIESTQTITNSGDLNWANLIVVQDLATPIPWENAYVIVTVISQGTIDFESNLAVSQQQLVLVETLLPIQTSGVLKLEWLKVVKATASIRYEALALVKPVGLSSIEWLKALVKFDVLRWESGKKTIQVVIDDLEIASPVSAVASIKFESTLAVGPATGVMPLESMGAVLLAKAKMLWETGYLSDFSLIPAVPDGIGTLTVTTGVEGNLIIVREGFGTLIVEVFDG